MSKVLAALPAWALCILIAAMAPSYLRLYSRSETSSTLAEGIWLFEDFLSERQLKRIQELAPASDSARWEPCSGTAHHTISLKRCTHVAVGDDPETQAFLRKLDHTFGVEATQTVELLPLVMYLPGADATRAHVDYFVNGSVPDMSLLFYLTPTPEGTGRTQFPNVGLNVQPIPGALLA